MRPHAVALAFLAIPALAAAAPRLEARSRIESVTVYRSSARVFRAAKVDVPAGPARLVFDGLPEQLDDDSLRVQGSGNAKARVFGVTVDRVTGEGAAGADARGAEEWLEKLQDEDRGLEDRLKATQARARFVESLRSTYAEERAKNLALRDVSTKEWRDVGTFVEAELAAVAAEGRRLEVQRRDLARRVAQARAELEKLQAKRGRTTKTVAVEVEAERAGALELTLSYGVPAAGWQPIWDARLAPDAGTMELTFLGSVWQRTGEDWSDVALSVSTAQPARGLYVPQLEPHYLVRAEPPRPVAVKRSRAADSAAMPSAPAERSAAASLELADEPKAELVLAQATVEQGLLSASFQAARRETVDGSGQARKVSLARFPLKAEVVRTAAPRLEAAAFLTAKAVNETGFPLLSGMAGVYVGDEFAGRAVIPATPPGGELELAFGADPRVEIDRKVLERRRESAGVISKDDVYRYRVRIAVKNRYAAPVSVKLLDLVPVSRDEKIRVELLEGTTAPTREDPERPGVRAWELALAPREERAIELRYEIRFPRGFPVAGLE
jgi:uncharacterized protein (TIGR02231 family)